MYFNDTSHPIDKLIDNKISTICPFKTKLNNVIEISLNENKIIDILKYLKTLILARELKSLDFKLNG